MKLLEQPISDRAFWIFAAAIAALTVAGMWWAVNNDFAAMVRP